MITPESVIVTMSDAREYQDGCVAGWKTFVEAHGFDFKQVVKEGLTARQLIDTGDQMAIDLADYAIRKQTRLMAHG